jgi:hypothetical protein
VRERLDWFPKVSAFVLTYRKALIAAIVFLALNALDGFITNYAYNATSTAQVEANPLLQMFVGHWALGLKGFFGLVFFALLAYFRRMTPDRLFGWLVFGCIVFIGIITWNIYATRLLW